MIEEKVISCICHLLHLHKTYSPSCHHRCSSTNKIITIHRVSAFPLENVVYFIQDIRCVHGSYVGETKQSLLTRMNSQSLLIMGLNNPVSIRRVLFPKISDHHGYKNTIVFVIEALPQKMTISQKRVFSPLIFIWITEGCVYQWVEPKKASLTASCVPFILKSKSGALKTWWRRAACHRTKVLTGWRHRRGWFIIEHGGPGKAQHRYRINVCDISCFLWLFTFKDK